MADLKDIRGTRVQSFSSDLSSPGSTEQLFYNTTNNVFKIARVGTVADGTWSSGGTPNAARSARGGAGVGSTALHFGGFNPTATTRGETETYNGTAWTEVGDLNANSAMFCPAQQGTSTAALAASGSTGPSDTTNNESWDGSSWTEIAELNVTHAYAAGAGTQTASLAIGRGASPRAYVESWNGSAWTEVGDLNEGRYFNAAAGTQNAALTFSGDPGGPFTAKNESWDGSSWTELGDMNTTRSTGGGFGIQTSAMAASGYSPTIRTNCEHFDGTSWTEVADVSTGRFRLASSGTSGTAGIVGGGQTPSIVGNVEEFTAADVVTKSVTSS